MGVQEASLQVMYIPECIILIIMYIYSRDPLTLLVSVRASTLKVKGDGLPG